jgi:hypothetical protein
LEKTITTILKRNQEEKRDMALLSKDIVINSTNNIKDNLS